MGVFGLATPETLNKADPSKMVGITFHQTEDLYAVAQAQVDELTEAGADLIVCLGHLGVDAESKMCIRDRSYSGLPARWPRQFLEGAAALAWMRRHAGEYGFCPCILYTSRCV